mgnify:CR=1 FL=1
MSACTEKKVRDTVYVLCGERNFFVAVNFFCGKSAKKIEEKKECSSTLPYQNNFWFSL